MYACPYHQTYTHAFYACCHGQGLRRSVTQSPSLTIVIPYAHRMTFARVTVGLGDAVTERQGSPSFSPLAQVTPGIR